MIEKIEIEILDSGHITNCYLLYNEEKEAVVIDPADKGEIIAKRIERLNLKLKYILLTHAHADHTLAIDYISNRYGVKTIANINEKDMILSKVDNCSRVFGLKQYEKDIENFIFLEDGDLIPFDGMKIRMIYTPGHTKGSVCYYVENENILITGDTLFSNCFGRCDLPSGNIEDMAESLVKLYKNFHNVYIYPGHQQDHIKIEDTYEYIRDYLKHKMMIDLNDLL